METLPLPEAIARFLSDIQRAECSPHTTRAYRTELNHLVACHAGPVGAISIDVVRAALARRDGRSPASRARTMAALNSLGYGNDSCKSAPCGRCSASPRGIRTFRLAKRVVCRASHALV